MPFYIDSTERTSRAKILACTTADAPLHIDYRNLRRILVFRYAWHHLYGSCRAMACTITTLHAIRQWYAVFLYPHGMPYLNRRFIGLGYWPDSPCRTYLRAFCAFRSAIATLV